jgi:superfamily II DNA or RNA helicase
MIHLLQTACITYSSGLGKTLVTLGLLLEGRSENCPSPNLIVSPTSVIAAQWKDEILKYVGVADEDLSSSGVVNDKSKFKVFLYQGLPVPYDEALAEKIVKDISLSELVLTDLSMVRKECHYISAQKAGRKNFVSPLFTTHWRRVIVDEVFLFSDVVSYHC